MIHISIFLLIIIIWLSFCAGIIIAKNILKKETVDCECGNKCPIEYEIMDEEGNWVCPNCYMESINLKELLDDFALFWTMSNTDGSILEFEIDEFLKQYNK